MLSLSQQLPFPELIYCGRTITEPGAEEPNGFVHGPITVPIYRLDWRRHDLEARPKAGYIDLLPQHWAAWLDGARFNMDDTYTSEIRHHCRAALLDWQLDAPFDKRIGEILQQPAVAHVETAFRLLADCLWDADKMQWERGHPRKVFLSAALLRFWDGKVAEVNCARLEELRELGPGYLVKVRDEYATGSVLEENLVQSFLNDVDRRFAARKEQRNGPWKERVVPDPETIDESMRNRPTHRCKVCGAHWRRWQPGEAPDGVAWSLAPQTPDEKPGSCCDNVAMGDQVEVLGDPPQK